MLPFNWILFRVAHQENHIQCNLYFFFFTGFKPFQCNVCEKSFFQSCDLNKHQRIQTDEKPYQSKICKKTFSVNYSKAAHKRIHTGKTIFM